MRIKKLLCIFTVFCVIWGVVACGGQTPPPAPEVKATLAVQCETVTRGECNAFVLTLEGTQEYTEIYYRMGACGEELSLVETSSEKTFVYRCSDLGRFCASATVRANGKLITSNTVVFDVVTGEKIAKHFTSVYAPSALMKR